MRRKSSYLVEYDSISCVLVWEGAVGSSCWLGTSMKIRVSSIFCCFSIWN